MTDETKLPDAWGRAETALLAALLSEYPQTAMELGVTDAAAARLRELQDYATNAACQHAENGRRASERIAELEAQIAALAVAPAAPQPAPAAPGDRPPVVTDAMVAAAIRAYALASNLPGENNWMRAAIDAAFAMLPPPDPVTVWGVPSEVVETLVDALKGALDHDQRNTCQHEETHRGGSIWTICDQCGASWADDRGGFPGFTEPPAWGAAYAALDIAKAAISAAPPPPASVIDEAGVARASDTLCRMMGWNNKNIPPATMRAALAAALRIPSDGGQA